MIGAGFGPLAGPHLPGRNATTAGQGDVPLAAGVSAAAGPAALRAENQSNAQSVRPVNPLTPEAITAIGNTQEAETGLVRPGTDTGSRESAAVSSQAETESNDPAELSDEEQAQVDKLQEIDAEVHRHEQAHRAAGGRYAGQASYTYEVGPDGQRYAVAGEVSIDTAPVPGDPEATIDKLEVVIRAALAPAQPSGQDLKVAAQARQAVLEARREASATEDEPADEAAANSEPATPADAASGSDGDNAGAGGSVVSGLVSSVYNAVEDLAGRERQSVSNRRV